MDALVVIAQLARELAAASSRRRVREIAERVLATVPGDALATSEARQAIDAVVDAAMRHAEVTERVAALSRRAHVEASELRGRLAEDRGRPDVVIASPSMTRLFYETLPVIARHDLAVLVTGETGTGKEVVVERIHALSRRAGRPFIDVSCAAITESLFESTMFGHERGAFTGAVDRRAGLFERADGGTLFLDEIGELPLAMQAKLLRVLETGRVDRVGGGRPLKVDVRVIAATLRSLEEMVAAGTFRADLFYRLSALTVHIPPLRERPEDVDALTRALVEKIAERDGRRAPILTEETLAQLRRRPWPGNVRELVIAIEVAMMRSDGAELVLGSPEVMTTPPSATPRVPSFEASSREAIERALGASGGVIYGPRGAARMLGLKPSTLQSKMQRLGIRRSGSRG
ncbi:MAG: sigma 54-interacting transcriptional regulator [Deltaproteobacteria bacterium]|nr:sigma 54-interacting transcriptional regulator [Deltaproteobacteria bacterium]